MFSLMIDLVVKILGIVIADAARRAEIERKIREATARYNSGVRQSAEVRAADIANKEAIKDAYQDRWAKPWISIETAPVAGKPFGIRWDNMPAGAKLFLDKRFPCFPLPTLSGQQNVILAEWGRHTLDVYADDKCIASVEIEIVSPKLGG